MNIQFIQPIEKLVMPEIDYTIFYMPKKQESDCNFSGFAEDENVKDYTENYININRKYRGDIQK